jgi:ParB/RepB/Spo0J family partition protein
MTKTNETEAILELPLAKLERSQTNRPNGSGFDNESLRSLADSILAQGIIEPLIVRPHPSWERKSRLEDYEAYQIVAGERRWRAAKLAKLETVPCIVRDLNDCQARELQIVENLQREGLHPVEEAKDYKALLDQAVDGKAVHTVESLAKQLGKSPAWIYGRLKLLRLPQVALAASLDGKLIPSNALLIARIPDPKLAQKAAIHILTAGRWVMNDPTEKDALDPERDAMSYRQAKGYIQENYMIRLKGAPFDQDDADLVPIEADSLGRVAGGACEDCPLRTGNMIDQESLASTPGSSADVCTNPSCFARKKAAAFKRAAAKAAADGHKLLPDESAARLFYNGKLHSPKYVDVRDVFPGEKKKTWEDKLGEHLPEGLIQARDDQKRFHFLIPIEQAKEAAQLADLKLPKDFGSNGHRNGGSRDFKAEQEKREKAIASNEKVAAALMKGVFEKVAKAEPNDKWWRWIAGALLENQDVPELPNGFNSKTSSGADCRCVLVAGLLFNDPVEWNGQITKGLIEACEFYGVDHKKLSTAALKQIGGEEAAAKAKGKD